MEQGVTEQGQGLLLSVRSTPTVLLAALGKKNGPRIHAFIQTLSVPG